MAKFIVHSSIDERGKATGGVAGDQTRKEICIREWYDKHWNMLLRIEDEEVRTNFANNMIDLAKNDNVGYDQWQRNTLLKEAEKVGFDFTKITTKCECDCSSAITICVLGAIYKVLGKVVYEKAKAILVIDFNCATTSTLKARMTNLKHLGIVVNVYTSKDYVHSTTKAVFGDIYNKSGSHVVCYINDGKKVVLKENVTNTDNNKVAYSKFKDESIAGTYITTSDLYLRTSAGKKEDNDIVIMPKGTKVRNYGFYNMNNDIKWLLVTTTIKGVKYTGYCSSKYLTK